MKSVLFGWLLGLGLLASHVGCCSIRMVGDGCDTGECGGVLGCDGIGSFGTLRSRIASRIRATNCGSGCGEIYWDEHINEPPVCDPCGCNGEFECGGGRTCPTALGRLRNLWGYRYVPANCEECSTCNAGMRVAGSCETCAGNTHTDHASETQYSTPARMSNQPVEESINSRTPTPASKPKPQRAPSPAPTPVPDSNAMQWQSEPSERFVVGSGVAPKARTTVAKPVTANAKQFLQGKPRLVTNPR